MTKLVKFNATTSIRIISDAEYSIRKDKLEELAKTDAMQYQTRLGYESNIYTYRHVKVGDELEVPNWWYETHKDSMVTVPVHLPTYYQGKDKKAVEPFKMDEALKHGQVKSLEKTQQVKLFDLVKDLDPVVQIVEELGIPTPEEVREVQEWLAHEPELSEATNNIEETKPRPKKG